MKRVLLTLLIVLLMTGCTITRIDKYDFPKIVSTILPLKVKDHNVIGKGYKYYAPKGVTRKSASEYNDILKFNNNYYYLYVDVVSYYYKTDFDYKKKDVYYSEELNYNGKKGYLEITKVKGKLFVEMMYNYAKIETYVSENELNDTMINLSYILSSIDFNDSLLKKIEDEGNYNSKEEVYNIFETKEKDGNFLEYIEEYDKYEETNDEEKEINVQEVTTTTSESE